MKKSFVQFTKMHGLGNDFLVINNLHGSFNIDSTVVATLSNRFTGIGFDQLLLIEPSNNADYFCRIFNADGSEAEQCGNGLRCVARFIHEEKIKTDTVLKIETKAGIFPLMIDDYQHIRIAMGIPHIKNGMELVLPSCPQKVCISVISLGNPHAITKVESLETIPEKTAEEIAANFPQGINVGFMQIINDQHVKLRTIERGSGETYACGSNACAAAAAGIKNGWLKHKVVVEFRYGGLIIEWQDENQPIYMTGPASRVFTGQVEVCMNS